jgi:Holliday junction resolvase RusA-like endonuclease
VTWHRDGGFTIVVDVPPVPASRPRVTRWGTYYLKTYKAYRDASDQAIPKSTRPALEGNLKATIEFACHRPPTTKRENPRGDIDNHVKSILDSVVGHAATKKRKCGLKGYIIDDMQITELYALKRWVHPGESPHTRIRIEQL